MTTPDTDDDLPDWKAMFPPLRTAIVLAVREAATRDNAHERCRRRSCRRAGECRGDPMRVGEPVCAVKLPEFAHLSALDHFGYALKLIAAEPWFRQPHPRPR